MILVIEVVRSFKAPVHSILFSFERVSIFLDRAKISGVLPLKIRLAKLVANCKASLSIDSDNLRKCRILILK